MNMIKLISMCVIMLATSVSCGIYTHTFPLKVEDEGFYHRLEFRSQKYYLPKGITSEFYGQVDTGSCNTVVPSKICFKCTTPDKISLLHEFGYSVQKTSKLKPKTYLSAQFQTVQVRDNIILDKFTWIPTTIELVVSSSTPYEGDTIIGLCPQDVQNGDNDYSFWYELTKRKYLNGFERSSARPLQRNTLAHAIKQEYSLIPYAYSNVFSIYLDPSDIKNKSTMIYGGIHHQFQQKPIVYFQNHETKPDLKDLGAKILSRHIKKRADGLYKSDFWKVKLTETRMGGKRIGSFGKPTFKFTLFDTGCTWHKAPKDSIDEIIRMIGLEVIHRGETQIIKCSAKQYEELGPLQFYSQGKVITLAKPQWVKFKVQRQQSYCAIMIGALSENWKGHFILGFNFFKQHYTVFDNEKNRIGVYDLGNATVTQNE